MTDDEVRHLRELVDERFDWMEAAQQLAYAELQRRLEELNHAHSTMRKDREEFLRIDTHDRFYTEFTTWKDQVNRELSNIQGRASATIVIIGFLFAILQVALHFWKSP